MWPAAVMHSVVRRVPGRKQSTTAARVKRRTVARVPRIGAPSGWPRQKFLVSTSCATDSGIVLLHADLFEDDLLFLDDVFLGKERAQHQVGEHVKSQRADARPAPWR